MMSRERVLLAVSHREPDRVPLNYQGEAEVNAALQSYLGIGDHESILQRLKIDFRSVAPTYCGPELPRYPDGSFDDIWGVRRAPVSHVTGIYNDVTYFPLRKMSSLSQLKRYPWPTADLFDYSTIESQCDRYAGYAITAGVVSLPNGAGIWSMDFVNGASFIRGMQEFVTDMAADPPFATYILERMTEFYYELARRIFVAGRGKIDIAWYGDDYGTQRGLLLSPAMWERYFAPRLKLMADLAHSFGLKVMLHSCGSCRALLHRFIELGVDILDTVQVEAAGMVPEELKREFGDKLAFHGALSTAGPLAYGTVEDVRREVKELVEVLGRGGGYVLSPTHFIQSNTPTENIVAAYDAALEFGWYSKQGSEV